ncbi:MAG: NAD(P)-dependent oxidoreductase [Anaerolineae bacterium]|nr:NAD(P)-dependent oxidoreductase [Anaerolineae bacterium]
MATKRVGFIGLGDMGMGMARNLLTAGFPVTGLDLRAERTGLLEEAGGTVAASAAELGRASDTVFIMVMNGQQVVDLLRGEDGLLAGMAPGGTVIVTATIEAREMREAAALLEGSGLGVIDSPVSGGRSGADSGTLTLMAAGASAVFAAQQDVLEAVGAKVFHVGEEPGMGQTVKASLQAFIGLTFAAIFESLALGVSAGIPGQILFDVISNTAAGGTSFYRENAGLVLERRFVDTGSQIGTMTKDLGISMALGRETGAPLFATGAVYELFKAAIRRFPDEDNQSVVKILETVSGVEVRR